MGEEPEWRLLGLFGIICLIQTFLDITPGGPWDSRSFSRGAVGLIGLVCIYIAWFRFTFKQKGLIPTIGVLKNPKKSWIYVMTFGIACYLFVILNQKMSFEEYFPETTGMIVLLIGSLSLLNSIYVWMVVSGPLKQDIVKEQE